MKNTLILLTVSALLSACAGTSTRPGTYACPLNTTDPSAPCASIQDAYAASSKIAPNPGYKVQSVFDPNAKQKADVSVQANGANPRGYFANGAQPVPSVGQEGNPVFRQPKVMRAWVAPYVDADGNLHSGEYSYFSTPGEWNYGTMKKPGAASNVYSPADPSNLGFDANVVDTRQQSRKAAPTPSSVANNPATMNPAGASNAAAKNAANPVVPSINNSVTQPYQRLSE